MYVSDDLVRLAESEGKESSVTVVVPGGLIRGLLCPVQRYIDWQKETLAKTEIGAGNFRARGGMPPPTAEQRERVVERWAARQDPDELTTFPRFALRNAEIRIGVPMYWPTVPYLMVDASHVVAMFLGQTND